MKRVLIFSVVAAGLFTASFRNNVVVKDEAGTAALTGKSAIIYNVTPASHVDWLAKKVTGQHNGTVTIKSGELKAEAGKLVAGKFVMDMKNIKVVDITDPATNGKLSGHLASDDFFSTEKFPEATFEVVSAVPVFKPVAGKPNYNIKGNLTIKGITKSITFPATVTVTDKEIKADAELLIDRTDFEIKYGSGKYFEGIGDKAIDDVFTVKFNLIAKA
jgi:polyisoprenoid-binding protein YceI